MYENVVLLGAVPATVRAVVPRVSVKVPLVLAVITFPFRSVPEPEPDVAFAGDTYTLLAVVLTVAGGMDATAVVRT